MTYQVLKLCIVRPKSSYKMNLLFNLDNLKITSDSTFLFDILHYVSSYILVLSTLLYISVNNFNLINTFY